MFEFKGVNLSESESAFFDTAFHIFQEKKLNPHPLTIRRLKDGTFNLDYAGMCYVGKIRLKDGKNYFQYFKGENVKELHNPTFEECDRPKGRFFIAHLKDVFQERG